MKKIIGFIAALVLMITLVPLQKAEASDVNKHFTVSVETLDVRENPSPRTKVVGSLKKGAVVFVYNTAPGGWSKIKYNNKAGYIATSGLKQNGASSPSPNKSTDVNKHFTVNVNTLNVKDNPSPRAKVIGSLKKGTPVFVYSTVSGGWSKIKYNGKAGYVASSGFVHYDKAYAAKSLVVKSSPSTSSKTVGNIKTGQTVEVYGGVPIGEDQDDFSTAQQYGWSKIKHKNKYAYVITHELKFADPYNWAPGVKAEFEADLVRQGYADSIDTIRYEKAGVYGNQGTLSVYAEMDGVEYRIVGVNVKTGWYHG